MISAAMFLIWIGVFLIIVSAGCFTAGNWPKKVTEVKADSLQVERLRHGPPEPSFVFLVQHPSTLKGSITGGGSGPFRLEIVPDRHRGRSLDVYASIDGPTAKPDDIKPFECEVPAGDYRAIFRTISDDIPVKTFFNLEVTHEEYPYRKLFDLAQTLLEVGVPLLITGIVLMMGTSIGV